VAVILNPALPVEDGEGSSHDFPADYFSANVLVANLSEAAEMTEQSDANIHTAKLIGSDLVARGAGSAIVTIGRRGCMVVDRNGADHVPAFEVELVDQTARGDAFAGALAASLAVKDSLREAAKFAAAAGALACTKFGSIDAMPAKAEIIELLQRQE
jgi:ribokinase